jgi:hypothetical protein
LNDARSAWGSSDSAEFEPKLILPRQSDIAEVMPERAIFSDAGPCALKCGHRGTETMRKITEFKGYRSAVEYDAETGQFVVTPLGDVFSGDETADSDASGAQIVPFPEPLSEPQKQRLAS